MAPTFTPAELDYLREQRLGRLATVDASGAPQVNPVGYFVDSSRRILIGGRALASTRKFRNAARNPHVAFVIDDLASVDPWTVRGIEIRGTAEALTDTDPPRPGYSRELIRITPTWIGSWGLESADAGLTVRT